MLHVVLTILQFICGFAIGALVLIQRGKGADAGAGFGAGASGTVFGARGASTALSRATAIFAAVFMANSLALAYMGTHSAAQPKTLLDTAGETAPISAPAAALPVPAAAVPAAGGGTAGASAGAAGANPAAGSSAAGAPAAPAKP